MVSTPVIAAIVAGMLFVSFGTGFAIENWRKGAEIERLKGQNELLQSAGGKCATDIKNVRAAMQAIAAEADERVHQAEEAMNKVEPQVKERTVTITKIKTLPPVPLDQQCEAIKEEQTEYVAWRRGV